MLSFKERKEETKIDPLEQFYAQNFPIGDPDDGEFDGPRQNSGVTRTYIYNRDRAAKMRSIASEYRVPTNGISVKYEPDAPGSSVGKLIVFQDGRVVQKIFLKPNVQISTNFNAMLTELLPIAMYHANAQRLLVKGQLSEKVKNSICEIITSPERAQKIINQIEQKIEFVRVKEDEIIRIHRFYTNALNGGDWSEDNTGHQDIEWLGQSKIEKNYGFVDRADVQLTTKCRVSLKSVTPTDVAQPIFLCNSTFKSFMRDMMGKTGVFQPKTEDFVYELARRLKAASYGELLLKFLNWILSVKQYNTYIVLHYILGDYCRKVREDGTGYNHILMTCAGYEPYELRADDGFMREAMNRSPKTQASVVRNGDKYYLRFANDQLLDISFKDKRIVPEDHANNLKFKILEKFKK